MNNYTNPLYLPQEPYLNSALPQTTYTATSYLFNKEELIMNNYSNQKLLPATSTMTIINNPDKYEDFIPLCFHQGLCPNCLDGRCFQRLREPSELNTHGHKYLNK